VPTSRAKLVKALVFVGGLLASFSFILLGEAGEKPAAVLSEASDTAAVQDFELQPWVPFFVQQGIASWYGPGFHGRRTASGTRYNMHELTAAHRSLPFGSLVRVENPRNGAAIIVQITDRGPFVRRNIIDLSRKAAELLDVRLHRVRIARIPSASGFLEAPELCPWLAAGSGAVSRVRAHRHARDVGCRLEALATPPR
jgi:rare lipoprotein A (peptidoglycan hydrolase)